MADRVGRSLRGCLRVLCGVRPPRSHLGTLGDDLGREWRTRTVTFKPYPVCAILQARVEAAVAMRHQREGCEFVRATLRLTPAEAHYPGTHGTAPFDDPGAALMSATYCLAVALSRGTVTAEDLFGSHDPALIEAAGRIELVADPALGARTFTLEVEFADGLIERAEGDASTAYNRDRDGIARNLTRLAVEVPQGIALDRLLALVTGPGSTPVAELLTPLTARSSARR